jgi:excisionase family DNA binding protein
MLPDDLITPKQAAALIHVSVNSVYRWVEIGTLRAWRVAGSRYRLSARDVRALVEEVTPAEPIRTHSEDEAAAAAAVARWEARRNRGV